MMIRLVVVDDHPIVREGIRSLLSQYGDIEVVGEADDAESALALCSQERPDVLLVDMSLPGPGIVELVRRFKSVHPKGRVVVFSVHPEQYYAKRILKAGADGYLSKHRSPEELASAIRQVQAGKKYQASAKPRALTPRARTVATTPPQEILANRECEVLVKIGQGMSLNAIAEELKLSPKTVRTYRARILEKLGLRGTPELIFYAVSHHLPTSETVRDPHPAERPHQKKPLNRARR